MRAVREDGSLLFALPVHLSTILSYSLIKRSFSDNTSSRYVDMIVGGHPIAFANAASFH